VFFLGHATLRCIGDPLAPATAPSLLGCFSTILEGEHLSICIWSPLSLGFLNRLGLWQASQARNSKPSKRYLLSKTDFGGMWSTDVRCVCSACIRCKRVHLCLACPIAASLLNTTFACIQYGADYASGAKSGGMRELHILLLKMAPSIQRTLVCQVAVDREMSGLPASNH
jgi:hypothetical protein